MKFSVLSLLLMFALNTFADDAPAAIPADSVSPASSAPVQAKKGKKHKHKKAAKHAAKKS